jgi:hypothetical protein
MPQIPKRITSTVEMADGTEYSIRVMPGDVVRMERHYGVSMAKLTATDADGHPLGDGILTEHAMFMAWSALSRTGEWSGDFESFIDQVALVEDNSPEAPTPSQPAP